MIDGKQTGLHHQRVESRFAKQQVHAALDQRLDLLCVRGHHQVECRAAIAWIVDVARDRELLVGRPDRTGHEARFLGRAQVHLVNGTPRQRRGGQVQLAGAIRELEIGHGDARGPERVGLDDVGAGFEILAVDRLDGLGLGDREDVDEVLQVLRVVGETLAAEIGLGVPQRVDHGSHRAVEHQDALAQQPFQQGSGLNVLLNHCHDGLQVA